MSFKHECPLVPREPSKSDCDIGYHCNSKTSQAVYIAKGIFKSLECSHDSTNRPMTLDESLRFIRSVFLFILGLFIVCIAYDEIVNKRYLERERWRIEAIERDFTNFYGEMMEAEKNNNHFKLKNEIEKQIEIKKNTTPNQKTETLDKTNDVQDLIDSGEVDRDDLEN